MTTAYTILAQHHAVNCDFKVSDNHLITITLLISKRLQQMSALILVEYSKLCSHNFIKCCYNLAIFYQIMLMSHTEDRQIPVFVTLKFNK